MSEHTPELICFQSNCNHPADNVWSYGPGRFSSGKICDCCMVKIWEETLRNVTKSIAELEVRCPK